MAGWQQYRQVRCRKHQAGCDWEGSGRKDIFLIFDMLIPLKTKEIFAEKQILCKVFVITS